MKLRAYRNPQNIDESRVPHGWRMLYAGELILDSDSTPPCRQWKESIADFDQWAGYTGVNPSATYIVPVNPALHPKRP